MRYFFAILATCLFVLIGFYAYQNTQVIVKRYISHYVVKKLSNLNQSIEFDFESHKIDFAKDSCIVTLNKIASKSRNQGCANIGKVQLNFKFGFLFTNLRLHKVTINDAKVNFDYNALEVKKRDANLRNIFSLADLVNSKIEIDNLEFNKHQVKNLFLTPKLSKKNSTLSLKVNEDNDSEIEIEIKKSKSDTIAAKLQSFDIKNSIFSELIYKFTSLDLSEDHIVLDGYVVFNLNTKETKGEVKSITGHVKDRITKGQNIAIKCGKFKFLQSAIGSFEVSESEVCIDNSRYKGMLEYKNGKYNLNGNIKNVSHLDLLKYWRKENAQEARKWFEENVKSGTIESANITVKESELVELKDANFENAEFSIKNNDSLIDVFKINGNLHFFEGNLEIFLRSGQIFESILHNFLIDINSKQKDTIIKITGSIKETSTNLALMAKFFAKNEVEQIKSVIDINQIEGNANVKVAFEICENLVKKNINIKSKDFVIKKLFSQIDIESSDLDIIIEDQGVFITGSGESRGKQFFVKLDHKYNNKTFVELSGAFDVKDLKNAGFIPEFRFLEGSFIGSFNINIDSKDNLEIEGSGKLHKIKDDFSDILGWEKDENAEFFIKCTKNADTINLQKFQLVGKKINISAVANLDSKKSEVVFDTFVIGDSEFSGKYLEQNGKKKLFIMSSMVDLSLASDFQKIINNNSKSNIEIECEISKAKLKNGKYIKDIKFDLKNNSGKLIGQFGDNSIINVNYDKKLGIDIRITELMSLFLEIKFWLVQL